MILKWNNGRKWAFKIWKNGTHLTLGTFLNDEITLISYFAIASNIDKQFEIILNFWSETELKSLTFSSALSIIRFAIQIQTSILGSHLSCSVWQIKNYLVYTKKSLFNYQNSFSKWVLEILYITSRCPVITLYYTYNFFINGRHSLVQPLRNLYCKYFLIWIITSLSPTFEFRIIVNHMTICVIRKSLFKAII